MAAPAFRWPGAEIVIVGSDIPGIEQRHIAEAFAALENHDVVFGPATDGGYWLVGFARRWSRPSAMRRLFRDVRWSSDQALADTCRNAVGARVALVTTLSDVDTIEDFAAWRRPG